MSVAKRELSAGHVGSIQPISAQELDLKGDARRRLATVALAIFASAIINTATLIVLSVTVSLVLHPGLIVAAVAVGALALWVLFDKIANRDIPKLSQDILKLPQPFPQPDPLPENGNPGPLLPNGTTLLEQSLMDALAHELEESTRTRKEEYTRLTSELDGKTKKILDLSHDLDEQQKKLDDYRNALNEQQKKLAQQQKELDEYRDRERELRHDQQTRFSRLSVGMLSRAKSKRTAVWLAHQLVISQIKGNINGNGVLQDDEPQQKEIVALVKETTGILSKDADKERVIAQFIGTYFTTNDTKYKEALITIFKNLGRDKLDKLMKQSPKLADLIAKFELEVLIPENEAVKKWVGSFAHILFEDKANFTEEEEKSMATFASQFSPGTFLHYLVINHNPFVSQLPKSLKVAISLKGDRSEEDIQTATQKATQKATREASYALTEFIEEEHLLIQEFNELVEAVKATKNASLQRQLEKVVVAGDFYFNQMLSSMGLDPSTTRKKLTEVKRKKEAQTEAVKTAKTPEEKKAQAELLEKLQREIKDQIFSAKSLEELGKISTGLIACLAGPASLNYILARVSLPSSLPAIDPDNKLIHSTQNFMRRRLAIQEIAGEFLRDRTSTTEEEWKAANAEWKKAINIVTFGARLLNFLQVETLKKTTRGQKSKGASPEDEKPKDASPEKSPQSASSDAESVDSTPHPEEEDCSSTDSSEESSS